MTDVDDLYALLARLRERNGGSRLFASCDGRMSWPARGVYFFFEPGETRPSGQSRVVRVGTHGLKSGSGTTLWTRLAQHRGNRPGGGNHRGSIFRLHVGQCLLARDGDPHGVVETWGSGANAPISIRTREHAHEVAVSNFIGRMQILWLDVPDEPGPASHRGVIEAGTIALLSQRSNPAADPPSDRWLGLQSSRVSIRESGLWNVRHVDGPTTDVLPLLETYIDSA